LINSLNELQAFLKICRKQGVTNIQFSGISVNFGDVPKKEQKAEDGEPDTPDELTPEQLMFYSAVASDQ